MSCGDDFFLSLGTKFDDFFLGFVVGFDVGFVIYSVRASVRVVLVFRFLLRCRRPQKPLR